jgi:hypothetical protein
MSPEEQYDWISKRQFEDPYWAQKEYDIRRQAAEVMEKLYARDEGYVECLVHSPGSGPYAMEYATVRIYHHDVARMGGLEGTLVVEELIRRAMGLSFEHQALERLKAARTALGAKS